MLIEVLPTNPQVTEREFIREKDIRTVYKQGGVWGAYLKDQRWVGIIDAEYIQGLETNDVIRKGKAE